MKKNSKGMVLIYCIILLSMVSILSMGSLELSQMHLKMLSHLEQHYHAMHLAESALHKAERQLSLHTKLPCIIDAVAENYFISHQIDSIKTLPLCRYGQSKQIATYIIETLSQNPCLKFRMSDGKVKQGGDYFRITVLGTVQPQLARVLLQTTFLLPSVQAPTCRGSSRLAQVGRQSWRQL